MGKKDAIRSLIISISLVSYHKVLYDKGEKSEAKRYLEDEIRTYSVDGFEKAQEFKFSKSELNEIELNAIKRTINIFKNKYPDIKFSEKEIKEKVIDTMQEFLIS